ncbi:class I glutamine amidotransferase-like protein [Cercophora newfieldiana]|uniref:Class I glutamine amidotransferase-like protein n=1 Tax=Cercophora newfieldiana TaxID=92897 RepID=A0AA39YRU3_9PEZI|nr:class I glutamine amidotransferase-like protein [Cercophora newfieldiana]
MGVPDSRKTVRLGVFMPAGAQLLDTACVDVLASMSYEYLSLLDGLAPPPILNIAPSVKIFHIGSVQPGEQIGLTAGVNTKCTNHYSDAEVEPGKLDIVLIPGPDPRSTYEKAALEWLAAHAARPETDILSVCTGIFVCGEAGLLKGKTVCGPRGLQSQLKTKFEGATWVGDSFRWIQDGNFWSCGGVTNGNDLVTAYARQTPKYFPGPIAEFGARITEVGDRPQKYEVGQTMFTLGMVWQVIKAAVLSIRKGKQA